MCMKNLTSWTFCWIYGSFFTKCIFIFLCTSYGEEITKQFCLEGNGISLRFTANLRGDSNTCNFTLDFNGVAFTVNGERIISNSFPSEKHDRVTVDSKWISDEFVILFSIQDTRSSDTGNYTCNYLCRNPHIIQVRDVTIFYPPHLIQCGLSRSSMSSSRGDYGILQCSFRDGHPSGYAICYARTFDQTEFITPFSVSGRDSLKRFLFLIENKAYVSCCVLSKTFMRSGEECNDFQIHNYTSRYNIPISDVSHQHTTSPTPSSTSEETTPDLSNNASEQIFTLLFSTSVSTEPGHRQSPQSFDTVSRTPGITAKVKENFISARNFVIALIAALGAGILLTVCLLTFIGAGFYRYMHRHYDNRQNEHFTSTHSNKNKEKAQDQQQEGAYECITEQEPTYEEPPTMFPPESHKMQHDEIIDNNYSWHIFPTTSPRYSGGSRSSSSGSLDIEHVYYEKQTTNKDSDSLSDELFKVNIIYDLPIHWWHSSISSACCSWNVWHAAAGLLPNVFSKSFAIRLTWFYLGLIRLSTCNFRYELTYPKGLRCGALRGHCRRLIPLPLSYREWIILALYVGVLPSIRRGARVHCFLFFYSTIGVGVKGPSSSDSRQNVLTPPHKTKGGGGRNRSPEYLPKFARIVSYMAIHKKKNIYICI